MTRNYEVVYIFDSALEEEQINEKLEKFHGLLKSDAKSDPITHLDHWGKRSLSYPINQKAVGYYVVAQVETEPTQLAEFERIVKLDGSVIRYLLVIKDKDAPSPFDDEEEASDAEESSEKPAKSKSEDMSGPRRRKMARSVKGFIDYKDVKTLERFITERGKIVPRRQTRLTARQQRDMTTAIKRARHLALLPYIRGYRS